MCAVTARAQGGTNLDFLNLSCHACLPLSLDFRLGPAAKARQSKGAGIWDGGCTSETAARHRHPWPGRQACCVVDARYTKHACTRSQGRPVEAHDFPEEPHVLHGGVPESQPACWAGRGTQKRGRGQHSTAEMEGQGSSACMALAAQSPTVCARLPPDRHACNQTRPPAAIVARSSPRLATHAVAPSHCCIATCATTSTCCWPGTSSCRCTAAAPNRARACSSADRRDVS